MSRFFSFNLFIKSGKGLLVFIIMLLPFISSGQSMRMNFDVSAKISAVQMIPPEYTFTTDSIHGQKVLNGRYVISISGSENMHINAHVGHSEYLMNEKGDFLPLTANFTWRNDGHFEEKPMKAVNNGSFPLSSKRLIISNMEENIKTLSTYIFINTDILLTYSKKSTFIGTIYIKIEYN